MKRKGQAMNAVAPLAKSEESELRSELALCYRLIDFFGWTEMIFNHISVRLPGGSSYLVNPFGLPYSFLEELTARGIRCVEIDPSDDPWINNSLAIAPGKLLMPEGASNRTLDRLAKHGVSWKTIPYAAVHKNGGGIHCSTTPLRRDPV